MDSLQGIPVEYKLQTFNKPRTGTTLCHPKIGYVDLTRNPALDTLALNSPLGHFNGDQRTPSPQVTRTPHFDFHFPAILPPLEIHDNSGNLTLIDV